MWYCCSWPLDVRNNLSGYFISNLVLVTSCVRTGGSIWLLYICMVLNVAVGVVVCKASVLAWWRVHLTSICMHGTKCSSRCSGMQGICVHLMGGSSDLPYVCMVVNVTVCVVVCNLFVLPWWGVHLTLVFGIKMCIGLYISIDLPLHWYFLYFLITLYISIHLPLHWYFLIFCYKLTVSNGVSFTT